MRMNNGVFRMEVRCQAVDYFCQVLENYDVNSVSPRKLHGHLGQASRQVRNYIKCHYSGEDFEKFFEEVDEFFISEEGYVSLSSDVENEAVEYFEEFFENNTLGLIHVSEIISLIEEEDSYISEYIFERYPDEDLLEFFEEHGDIFSVANGCVALISERDLASEEQDAVEYLSEVVKQNSGYFHANELKAFAMLDDDEGHGIIDLINDFYPEDSFCDLLEKYDNIFFFDYEGFVYLKEHVGEDAVDYFKDIFISKIHNPIHYTSLYGHIGQAPAHIMKYINEDFGRKGFLEFLKIHNSMFKVKQLGFVTYIGHDAAVYFADVLENYYDDMPHYSTFRGHIGQAPSYIMNFINTEYPNEQFYDFLLECRSFFDVDEDGYVALSADYERPQAR